ncbi:MAG: hypothetical protein Q8865_08390 [Bacillota bacterium]|nr:hypothetical protein [Bacillota bacterium]
MIFFISLIGCTVSNVSNSPPELKILYKDKSVEAIKGTYSWASINLNGAKTFTTADCSAPPELVRNSVPMTVSANSPLSLSFSKKPSKTEVRIWHDNDIIKQQLVNGKIIIPEQKGKVIYEVIGTWKNGTVYYTFLVNVE